MTTLEIDTILNLMIAYNLTADELLLVYLTFLAQEEEGHPEYFAKWFSNGGQSRLKELFESLKEKGIIHKDYNPKAYNPDDIEFNKNFLKGGLKGSGEMGRELFEEYPPFLETSAKGYPLKNISKHWHSLEDFFFTYSSAIKHNPNKHKEVMELLRGGKQNDLIKGGISDFVISHQWETLKEIKDSGKRIETVNSILEDY